MASPPSASRPARPISPHLTVYRWGPHMLVSILHRATGDGMATVGAVLLVWWLAALAGGADSYAHFQAVFAGAGGSLSPIGWLVGIGLTLSLFQHMMSGIRHLVMDTGAAFELKRNRGFAVATMLVSVTLTTLYWLYLGDEVMGDGTSIGRVRGLGSAKEGTHHWWHQRLTAGSNLLLMLWLVLSLARLPGYDYGTLHLWLASAWAAVPMALLIVSVFWHFRLGLQVVIEDYAHAENRVVLLVLLNLFVFVAGGIALFSILRIAFGAAQ